MADDDFGPEALRHLSTLSPSAYLAECRQRLAEDGGLRDINGWLAIATRPSQDARRAAEEGRRDEALLWARAAGEIYAALDAASTNPGDGFDIQGMHLRVFIINALGADESEDLLSPVAVIRWFESRLPFDLATAQARSVNWEALSKNEILKLRMIKTRANVIANLSAEDRASLADWLQLRPNLP